MAPTINGFVGGRKGRGRKGGPMKGEPRQKVNVKNLHVKNAAIFSPDDSRKFITVSREPPEVGMGMMLLLT
jgi:hypothetical protein